MIQNGKDAWRAGILTACTEGVWILLFYLTFKFLDHFWHFDEFYEYAFRFDFLLALFVVILGIQGFMTWAVFRQSGSVKKIRSSSSQTGYGTFISRYTSPLLCILLVLTVVLPGVITFGAMRMNMIGPITHSVTYIGPTPILPERVSNDTIVITTYPTLDCISVGFKDPFECVKMGYTNPFINPAENRYYFLIKYNSKDISDQETIDRQGLSLTIDPPQGIQRVMGSHTVLKGPEISNTSSKGHLEIYEVNPSLGSIRMKTKWVDWEI
jgi:hypothetical protein